jgi:hypothetical protein
MKNFYEFYRKLNANKLFEQDGMPLPPMAGQTMGGTPQMPDLASLGSAPNDMAMPGMPSPGVPGMEGTPQAGATEMGEPENTSPSGEENVDQPEGMDDTTPEGKIMKAVTDIESALSDMEGKGSGLGDRAETIADLIKMIKKNVEKGSSGDEEGEEEENQGPPIGDPSLMMGGAGAGPLGGQQDADNMDNAGQSNMPNQASPQAESYYNYNKVLNESGENLEVRDTSAIRALWGGYTKELKDMFRCKTQQEYKKGLFWDVFSNKDASDIRLAVTRNTDDDGDEVEKKYHVAITHYPDEEKEWSTHRYLFPGQNPKSPVNRGNELKFRKGDGHSYELQPATMPHVIDLQTKDLLKSYKGDISKFNPDPNSSEDKAAAEVAAYNFKMLQRMEFCGWLPKDYVTASGEFVKQKASKVIESGEDVGVEYYVDKYTDSKLKTVKENKRKAKQAFIKFVQQLLKQSPEIKQAVEGLIGTSPADQAESFKTLFIRKAGEDKPKSKTIVDVVDMLVKASPKLKTGAVRELLANMASKRDYIFKPFEASNAILVSTGDSSFAQSYTNPAFEVSSAGEIGVMEEIAPEEPKVLTSMKKKLSSLDTGASASSAQNLNRESVDMIRKLSRVNVNDRSVPGVLRDYWSIRNQMESVGGELYNVPKNSRVYENTLIDLEKQLKVGRFTPTNPLDLNFLLKA